MKIVFTTQGNNWEDQMDPRFGRALKYVLFDEEKNELKVIENSETDDMQHGAGLQSSKKVLEMNPDVIITGNGAGQKALDILKRSSVKLYMGAGEMTIKEAYEAFKANKLESQF